MATTEEAKKTREEFERTNDALLGIAASLVVVAQNTEGFDEATKKVVKTYSNDLAKATDTIVKSNQKQLALQEEIVKGGKKGAAAQKEYAKEQEKADRARKIATEAINTLRSKGIEISAEDAFNYEEINDLAKDLRETTEKAITADITRKGILGNILETSKEYLISLDKSGLAAELLNGNLDGAQKAALIGEAALIAIAKATLAGSNNINNLQKNLGISYGSAYQLQNSLKATSNSADKLFITSTDLNKSFTDLVETTGLISDFGGDTLVTMTALTKQLGLGTAEASQLALLARTQGTDTESILENTVKTVNAVNRQNGAAISAKAVLNDVATASKAIVVSLGMSPEILAEAATEARTLGLSLSQVDDIAGSLLDFESSIENELAFQMLTGKEINLDKARQLALDNDLLGLGKEIGENAEITEAFATGSRIQQEAAAAALGISREAMANMVYQQGIQNLQKDEFIAKFGEQNYLQMQSMSASQKFEASMEKIKGVITDIGTIFAPIVDMFASVLGYLAKSEIVIYAITGALGAMAAKQAFAASKSIITAVGSIFTSAFKTMNPILGIALAGAGIGALYGAVSKAQSVKDGIAPSDRGPFTITDAYGAMATTTSGDSLMASPNVGKGGGNSGEMVSLLKTIANKNSAVYMDSSKVGYADALSYSKL
jgi:hypothetical protein